MHHNFPAATLGISQEVNDYRSHYHAVSPLNQIFNRCRFCPSSYLKRTILEWSTRNFRISFSWWFQSFLRRVVSEKPCDLTLHGGVRLHLISISLMEVKFLAMTLALHGRGNICCRTKRHDLPVSLQKLTLATKAGWTAGRVVSGPQRETKSAGFLEPLPPPAPERECLRSSSADRATLPLGVVATLVLSSPPHSKH